MLLHDWWASYLDVPHVCWFSLLQPEDHAIFCTSQAAGCCVRCWWSVYFGVSITYLYIFGKNVQCTLTIIKIICRYVFLSSGEWLLPLLPGRELHPNMMFPGYDSTTCFRMGCVTWQLLKWMLFVSLINKACWRIMCVYIYIFIDTCRVFWR